MFNRSGRVGRHALTILRALFVGPKRRLLGRMVRFGRTLPGKFDRPLPDLMAELTPAPTPVGHPPDAVRGLADAVAAWQFRSPLGICLRRSLLRYYFLREAGLPVTIVFGARLKNSTEGSGIGGHAWLTLNGIPYYENPVDYRGFAEMYVYPPPNAAESPG